MGLCFSYESHKVYIKLLFVKKLHFNICSKLACSATDSLEARIIIVCVQQVTISAVNNSDSDQTADTQA